MSETAVKIENLTKIYKRSHLGKVYKTLGVKDLNLEIYPGEIFGLIGLNGSGKTTTIKLILGLIFPTAGKIKIFDYEMPDRKALAQMGYLPELPYFQKFFTGREMLEFYCQLSLGRTDKKRVDEVIGIVDLSKNIDKRLKEFSKGMLQRLALAQSLISNPPLLIFDELVSGLDPLGVLDMRNFINTLKTQKKTVFFSSHLISEVERVCDRVGILHKGELKKILNHNDWADKEGKLEQIFIETVKA